MKNVIVSIALLVACSVGFSQTTVKKINKTVNGMRVQSKLEINYETKQETKKLYSRARIHYNSPKGLVLLANQGLAVDHGKHKKGVYIESDFSQNELNIARGLGMEVEVLIKDVKAYYVEQNKPGNETPESKNYNCSGSGSGGSTTYTTPSNFSLGSMGGYFTYQEMLDNLDAMVAQYPNIITAKAQIHNFQTYEGEPIYWVKISDNPNTDEAEPELLTTSIHHAREPASLSQNIFYMWYLLENYATDPEVQAIVNNTELFFVPVVNPDGYIYNSVNDASGGGLWRKNRRDHFDGEFGVDPNRNYSYEWGTTGVSATTDGETYPGSMGFSEPETQAMKWFTENHEFTMALNYHTYGNLLLYPFGYDNVTCPDDALFQDISGMMVAENGFNNMISAGLYPASGDSDDWMYADVSTKPKILAMTPEVGADNMGFWPPSNQIINICNTTMFQNLTAAHLITNYGVATDVNASLFNGSETHLRYELQRLGMENPGNFTVTITPIQNISFPSGATNVHNGLALQQTILDSVAFVLDGSISSGDEIIYVIELDNGQYIESTTITKTYGAGSVLFADNGTSIGDWTTDDWNTTSLTSYSAPTSYTDSPGNNNEYENQSTNAMELDNSVDLSGVLDARVTFWAKWAIEPDYDYVEFQVSTDGGSSWINQCGNYTEPGTGDQDQGEPLYDGFQNNWVQEEINLSDYLGQTIKFRFILVSDNFVTEDGFYFDDLEVHTVTATGIDDTQQDLFVLDQNMPNPVNGITHIGYELPKETANGKLIISNSVGQIVETISLSSNSKSVAFNTNSVAVGTYFYHIETEGSKSPAKRMVVVK